MISGMFPYLLMLALPAVFALTGTTRPRALLLIVAAVYVLMIGFRFQVGMDWNNYIGIYLLRHDWPIARILGRTEPGFGLLMWTAGKLGGGLILVNAVAGLVFCIGFFAVAIRCREPMLAILVATPLLVVSVAMSGTRQAMACGIIFFLFATWEKRSFLQRVALVLFAMLFHFSALFVMIFVALGTKASNLVRLVSAAVICGAVFALVAGSDPIEKYSRLYVSGQHAQTAQGAIVQVGVLTLAALIYFMLRKQWVSIYGESRLHDNLAAASLIALPSIWISSVGAYRFALYFWPIGMYVFGGLPALIQSPVGRAFYRIICVVGSFATLVGWLLFANTSFAWLPYENWLMNRGAPLYQHNLHGTER